jgi:hypothetical protein
MLQMLMSALYLVDWFIFNFLKKLAHILMEKVYTADVSKICNNKKAIKSAKQIFRAKYAIK